MFCQSAIESAQNDHAMVVQSMIDNKTAHLTKIKALFSEIGAEESGVLTLGVFEEKLGLPAVPFCPAFGSRFPLKPRNTCPFYSGP